MLNTKPRVFANVSHETRAVSEPGTQRDAATGLDSTAGIKTRSGRLRVLLIAPSLDIIGGQSVQAHRLYRQFADEPELDIRFLAVNPRLPRILRTKYIRTIAGTIILMARLIVEVQHSDVLHVFTPGFLAFYLAPAPALLIARLLGKPAILNYHDGRAEDHLANWPSALRLMRWSSEIVVPSDYLVKVFARFGMRARCVHNVASATSLIYRERPRPRPIFLHTRGLAREYNPECTLRAFAIVQHRYREARLVIAHDGPLRSELEFIAAALGLRHTQFIGEVAPTDIAALYDSADLYLMSPNADNMPLSVLECFAAGLPVISSSAGGIPELIEDEVNGLLFPPDDHEAMARCAFRLLEEPGLAFRLAAYARAGLARYCWQDIGPQWMAIYREMAATRIRSA